MTSPAISIPAHPFFQQISLLNRSSPNFHKELDKILHRQEYEDCLKGLTQRQRNNVEGLRNKKDLEWLVNYLDGVLPHLDPDSPASRKCIRELKTRCRENGIFPKSYEISSGLYFDDRDRPIYSGGFGDVYKGTYKGSAVSIKRLRASNPQALQAVTGALCEEAVTWKHLDHPNVLPLLGITTNQPQLVSPWVDHGDLMMYIEQNPGTDRLELLSGVAKGLRYLHARHMIHGDIKPPNILVCCDRAPRACLTDFGITIVTKNQRSIRPATVQNTQTTMYSAPEVLSGANPSHESDVYSFSMVMFAVFSGVDPFRGKTIYTAAFAIMGGERPDRPTHFVCTDNVWNLMQRCWVHESHSRPAISDVLTELQHAQNRRIQG